MMIVSAHVYQKFYEVLRKIYYEREIAPYPERVPTNGIDSPDIWMRTDEKGKYLATKLFPGSSKDPKFFWRLYLNTDPEYVIKVKIRNVLGLAKALEYVGVKPPKEIEKWGTRHPGFRAQILFDIFIKEHELDEQSAINNTEQGLTSKMLAAKEVVEKYNQHIASLEFNEAWLLLSPEFQSKNSSWLGDYNNFELSFKNTIARKNVAVFNFSQPATNVIHCYVYYESVTDCYTVEELISIDTLKVKHIDIVRDRVIQLKEYMESRGLFEFEKIEIYKLFDPSVSDYIWKRCNYDPSKLPTLFDNPKNVRVNRLYEFSCKLYGDKWLINNFNGLNTFSNR